MPDTHKGEAVAYIQSLQPKLSLQKQKRAVQIKGYLLKCRPDRMF
jgi:hypothetical protein